MRVMPHAHGIIPQAPVSVSVSESDAPYGCRRTDDQHDVWACGVWQTLRQERKNP